MNKIVLSLSLLLTTSLAVAGNVKVAELRCEYRDTPLGIENTQPRLSWKIVDEEHTRGQKQSGYQIEVASSLEKISRGEADLWDSGKVSTDQSVGNTYKGKALTSREECFWRVRVWDAEGDASQWSEPTKFTMGLLDQTDWQGEWIYHQDQNKVDHKWYRKSFTLDEKPQSAYIYLGAFGYTELYVNGEKVTDDILNPAMSYHKNRVLYLTYDIADKLKEGDNVIAIWHGAGWARWNRIREYRNPPFALIADVDIDDVEFGTDTSWLCKRSNSSYYGDWDVLGFGGEVVDGGRTEQDWNTVGYDDSDWDNAIVYVANTNTNDIKYLPTGTPNRVKIDVTPDVRAELTAKLTSQLVEPQVKYQTITPTAVKEGKGGTYIVDMGRNYTGTFEMELHNGTPRDSVLFEISDQKTSRISYKQKSAYIFGESGEGKFENRFNVSGGRYVTISGLSYKPELSDIKGYVITSDRAQISHFDSSNELINKIYQINLDTYIANAMDGILVDCPHRERRGWGEVTVACMYGDALPNFESGAYMEQYTQFMRDAQFSNGGIRGIVNEMDREFLMWKANNPITILETYKTYGDMKILQDNYESMQRWFTWLYDHSDFENGGAIKAGKQGSRDFPGLGDWSTPRGNFWESSNSPSSVHFNNSLYAYMLECAVTIAEAMGDEKSAKTYTERLKVQREATHRQSYDATTGKYVSGIQIDQLSPLVGGVTPEAERKKVTAQLVDNILYGFPYYDTGSSGQSLYTRYFLEEGERMDLVYELLTDTAHPSYGYFISQDETTWPEHWSSLGGSRIHTCFTGIGGYFVRGFGGIRPDNSKPGMQHFIVKPAVVGDLTYANTEYDSQYGKIKVNWKRNNKTASYHIEVPVNTTATVYIPAAGESGVVVDDSNLVKYLGEESSEALGNYTIYQVESGVYDFEVTKLPTKPAFPEPLYQGDNLSRIGRISSSSTLIRNSQNPMVEAFRANDENTETKWTAKYANDQWLEAAWITPQRFSSIVIDEEGDNIESYEVQAWIKGAWKTIAKGDKCGANNTIKIKKVTADKCRLYINSAKSAVSIKEFKVLK